MPGVRSNWPATALTHKTPSLFPCALTSRVSVQAMVAAKEAHMIIVLQPEGQPSLQAIRAGRAAAAMALSITGKADWHVLHLEP